MSGRTWRRPPVGEGWANTRKRILTAAAASLAVTLAGFSSLEGRPSTASRAPRHISLLIGIGNYEHSATKAWRDLNLGNLRGPSRDVLVMKGVLRNWGFPESRDDQLVLVDRQATRERIRQAFAWLAARATDSSDVVVIYYSGHGSWARDENIDGVRKLDEARLTPGDSYDEGLVPADARDPNNPRQLVLDDEIGLWLSRLRTANVTVIIDACFSGTITRGSPDPSSPSAPVAKGRSAPPQAPGVATSATATGLLEGGRRMNHTLLTAASSHETAYERTFQPGSVPSGVFTRALVQAINGADPHIRFDELMQHVRVRVSEGQTPQVEGERGARLFRVGSRVVVPARGYAIVRSVRSGRVGIDVGALHGVRKGSTYDVFPPGETSFRGTWLAQVKVDSIFEASSYATVVAGARTLPAGARATLSRVPPGAMALDRLRVYVHPSARPLRDSLARFTWLQLTDRPARATAELRRRGTGYQVLVGGHDVPPLPDDVSNGYTAAPGAAGTGFLGSTAALCSPLRRAYSVVAMGMVRNDEPPPPSRLQLHIRVLPVSETPPAIPRATTADTAYVGQRYNIWAWVQIPEEARTGSPLYLNVALAGQTGEPEMVWPRGDGITPRLTPAELNKPFLVGSGFMVSPPTGIESIKAVVSSDDYTLRTLLAALPRCPAGGRDRGRGDDTENPLVVTGWTAVDRRVEIQAR